MNLEIPIAYKGENHSPDHFQVLDVNNTIFFTSSKSFSNYR